MKIAIVHYHLRPGGVTRVIQNALQALEESDHTCCVLTGEDHDAFACPDRVRPVEALGYSERPMEEPRQIITRLRNEAAAVLGGPPDLWHLHNHSLGKNPTTHQVAAELARQGERMLLQIHDFAEDGRPGNYQLLREADADLDESLYPAGPRVHYGLLNGRDYALLKASGADEAFLHFLPNSVQLDLPDRGIRPEEGRIVYPSRGIRRKNIGEVLLWATQAAGPETLAITLAPEDPEARKIYEDWARLAHEMKLPVEFNAGAHREFSDMLQSASCLLTTSVAEGFGLAYLESWLVPRRIVGRDLPDITRDFRSEGLELPQLYSELPIPSDWIDLEDLRVRVQDALEKLYRNYGLELPADRLDEVMSHMTAGGSVDFGRLGEFHQQQVLPRVIHEGPPDCLAHPPWREAEDGGLLKRNRDCVRKAYSLEKYRERLETIYAEILGMDGSDVDFFCSARVLQGFLSAKRFNLLRT